MSGPYVGQGCVGKRVDVGLVVMGRVGQDEGR